MPLPELEESGDLPSGVHRASLSEVLDRFGSLTPRRRSVGLRLHRVHRLASSTGRLARLIVFGSFVTGKDSPDDVDVFLLMQDEFDVAQVDGEAAILFDHLAAQAHFGASVFWLRPATTLDGEQAG